MHVVVEKPMALRLQDADGMIRACDEAGVKLFVVKQNRFNVPIVKARGTRCRQVRQAPRALVPGSRLLRSGCLAGYLGL